MALPASRPKRWFKWEPEAAAGGLSHHTPCLGTHKDDGQPGLSSDTKYEVMSTVFSPRGVATLWAVPIVCEVCGTEPVAHRTQKPLYERRHHTHLTRRGLRPRARHKPGA